MRRMIPWAKDGSVLGTVLGVLVLLVGFVFPLAILAVYSVWTYDPLLIVVPELTFANYVDLFTRPYSQGVFMRTLGLAAAATVICLVVGYAVSLYMRRSTPRERGLILIALLTPVLLSDVVLGYAFLVLLGRQAGALSQLLNFLGFLDGPMELIGTDGAVLIGLVYVGIGFMVINLYASLESQGDAEERAAAILGAGRMRTFFSVTFPMSLPGALSGGLITFATTASAFVIPQMLGAGKSVVMSVFIYDLNTYTLNWPLGAAGAMGLLVVTLATSQVLVQLVARRDPRRVRKVKAATDTAALATVGGKR